MVGLVAPGLMMIAVTYGLARFAYGLFLPELREAFGLDDLMLGLIGAGSYVGYCVAIVLSLVFTSRIGPRRMIAAAGTVAVLGMALIATAPSAWMLAAGVLVAGTSTGLASPPMGDAVAQMIAPAKQDQANAMINSGTSAGVAISAPVALMVADQWRLAWAAFAAIGLAVLAWNVAIMPGKGAPSSGVRDNSSGEAVDTSSGVPSLSWRWFLSPRSLPLFVTAVGIGVASAAYWTFSRDLILQVGQPGPSGATAFWILLGVSGVTGAAAGNLVGRFGLTPALRSSLIGMAGATGLLAALASVRAATYLSATLFGASYIMLTGIVLVWSVAVFRERPSAGIGASFFLLAAGQALGAPLAGALADATGLRITFVVFAGVALATTLLRSNNLRVRRVGPEFLDPRLEQTTRYNPKTDDRAPNNESRRGPAYPGEASARGGLRPRRRNQRGTAP